MPAAGRKVGGKRLLVDPRVVDARTVHSAEIAMGAAAKHGPGLL
jgi:hypothetical protein